MKRLSVISVCLLVAMFAACGSKNNDNGALNNATNNSNSSNNGTNNTTATNNVNVTPGGCEGDDDCTGGQVCDADGQCVDDVSCGDGVAEGDEQCDGDDLGGATCDAEAGLSSGEVTCTAQCELDTSGCYTCGDGSIDGPEVCDGEELGDATCVTEGAGGGTVSCASDCLSVDGSTCWTCNDGTCDLALGEYTGECAEDCGWSDIAVGRGGNTHVCAVKNDGTVWCWGSNNSGQLGDGTFDDSPTPVRVSSVDDAIAVELGELHSCALGAQGDAWCWGLNVEGQLGDGSTINASTPKDVFLEDPATSISAGRYHTCATVNRDGLPTALCWGANGGGRLGDGTNETRLVPTAISPTMTAVSAGITHSCGIDAATDEAYCWGTNGFGQLGDGTRDFRYEPDVVDPPAGIAVLEVGAGSNHSCAVLMDGSVSCWGDNGFGALGTGPLNESIVPIAVDGLDGLTCSNLEMSYYTNCVLAAGTPYCWGNNSSGQFGDGTTSSPRGAVQIPLTDVTAIATGEATTCAITADGSALCWGDNQNGQVGDGTVGEDDVLSPTAVIDPYAAP